MDAATLIILAVGLFIAWLIGPIVVIHYRCIVVPRRFEEIRDRFLANNPGEAMAPQNDREQSGAWHYARLIDPDSNPTDPEAVIKRQFWHFHGWDRYWVPLAFVIVLSALMLAFSGLWLANRLCPTNALVAAEKNGRPPAESVSTNAPPIPAKPSTTDAAADGEAASCQGALGRIPVPFVMALWGAYAWSLYEILSRRKSGDLTPIELYDIASRYVTAIPLGYAFSLLAFETVPALAAFVISAFPLRDIRQIFRKHTLSKLDDRSQPTTPAVAKGYLGDTLSGVGNDTIARLEELNIETYLDLAYADPIKLLIKTGVPIEVVLSWIDQAIVSVYAAPHKTNLALYGMPCALDICEFYTRNCWDIAGNDYKPTWNTDPAVQELVTKLGIPAEFVVKQILRGIYEDPHTKFLIRVWFGPAQSPNAL